jgi:uncharacterized membrane protein YqhA
MHICIHTHILIYINICICICIVHAYMYTYTYTNIIIYREINDACLRTMYKWIYVNIYLYMYVCVCLYIYVYAYRWICICMNIFIYIDCTSNVILSSINQMDIVMASHIYHLYVLMYHCIHTQVQFYIGKQNIMCQKNEENTTNVILSSIN